jgi:DNA-binding response OmpR family regulator
MDLKIKVLLVEDEEAILMGLKYCLEQEGFVCFTASSGEKAIEIVKKESVDLVLLDLNLPDMNGFEVMENLKKTHDFPIIFLTANLEEVSIVKGLDMGADDYITKPFKTRELISRMKAVLRCNQKNTSNLIHLGNVTIDLNSAKVLKNGKDVMLTVLEYKILLTLAMNPNHVFTREKILADIWDVNEEYVNDNTLTVYIKRIREKIEDDVNHPTIIQTVRGIGYKIGKISD